MGRQFQSMTAVLLLALALLLLPTRPAHAYVDPGSGALMVQALLASIVGISIAMRRSLRRVLGRLGLSRRDTPAETEDSGSPTSRS